MKNSYLKKKYCNMIEQKNIKVKYILIFIRFEFYKTLTYVQSE